MKLRLLALLRRMTKATREAQLAQFRRSRAAVFAKAREIPDHVQRIANQLRLLIDMVEDFADGRYREVPWYSVAIAVLASLYVVSPEDLVPDFIPVLGQMDDVVVIALAVRLLRADLIKYCKHKGLDPALYFAGTTTAPR